MCMVPILCGLKSIVPRERDKDQKVGQLTLEFGHCSHRGMYSWISRACGQDSLLWAVWMDVWLVLMMRHAEEFTVTGTEC